MTTTDHESLLPLKELRTLAEAARSEQQTWWLWDEAPPKDGRGPILTFASAASPEQIIELCKGIGALVATARCYKRPDSKLDPDPGPCLKCAACLARIAYYGVAD